MPHNKTAGATSTEQRCPYCKSNKTIRKGQRKRKFGTVQMFSCK
jgi:transposase-like protein